MRLAEAAGVSKATVSRWASGAIIADMDRWSIIEGFFGWESGRVATELGAVPERSVRNDVEELREQVQNLEREVERLLELTQVREDS